MFHSRFKGNVEGSSSGFTLIAASGNENIHEKQGWQFNNRITT